MKKLVIFLFILIIIASIGIGGYFIYQKYKPQDPFELEWVRLYYDYMRKNHETLKINQNGLKYYRENEKIEFCKIEDIKNPVMLYNYKELGVSFTNIFYINDNNEVKLIETLKKDFEVEYLYDIEKQIYEYYAHETYDNKENYIKISEIIKTPEENDKFDYIITFVPEEKDSVTTLDGQLLEISKFDQKFIKTTVVEDNWKDINFNNYEDAIKKYFSVAVRNMENVLTEEVQEGVREKEIAILSKKEDMTKAIQEIQQKEEEERRIAEEEARIKAEEEARIKAAEEEAKKKAEEEAIRVAEEQNNQEETSAENYTLQYGTYKGVDCWSENDPLSKYETTIVLNSDGTYTQTNVVIVADMTEKYSGTYTISKDQNLGTIIRLSANDTYYFVTENNQFTSVTGSIIKLEN